MKVHGREMSQEDINDEMKRLGRVRTQAEVIQENSRLEMRRVGMLLLNNEDGRLLLSMLEEMHYKGDIRGIDTHETYYKLGERGVVDFLLGLRDQAKKEK